MKQYIIGTAPSPQKGQIPILVNDPKGQVSRNHCLMTIEGNQITLEDLGSLNGTFVNGNRITQAITVTPDSHILLAGKIMFDPSDFITAKPGSINEPNANYAGFGMRFLAYLLDGFIVGMLVFAVGMISAFFFPFAAVFIQMFIILLVIHFYYALPISRKGATFARKIFGIQYLDLSTMDYPSAGKVWLRTIAYSFSGLIFGIGFLMALFTRKKQALHDLMANTIVTKV